MENMMTENDEMTPCKTFKTGAKIFPSQSNISQHKRTKSIGIFEKSKSPEKKKFDDKKLVESHSDTKEINRARIEMHRLQMENQRLIQQKELIVKHYEAELTELRETFQKELDKLDREKLSTARRSYEEPQMQAYIELLEGRIKLKDTSTKQMEIKLENNQIIQRNLEEQIRGLKTVIENQQRKIESIQKSVSLSTSDGDSAKRLSNALDLKFDFKRLEQDHTEDREKLRILSNKSSKDIIRSDDQLDDREILTKELYKIKKENSDLSLILKSQLLSTQKSIEEKDAIIVQLNAELKQSNDRYRFQSSQLIHSKSVPATDDRPKPKEDQMANHIKTVLLMIEIERLHSIIRELTEKFLEQQSLLDRSIISQHSNDLSLEKIPLPMQKESEAASEISYQQFEQQVPKTQIDRLAEEFRKSDLKSYFAYDSLKSDNETSSHISDWKGSGMKSSAGRDDLPKSYIEKAPESTFKVAKLEGEIEKLNGLLAEARGETEGLRKKSQELEESHAKQVELIQKTMETFVKDKIVEELKQYESTWTLEKENKDRIIENQKGLIAKLKEKISFLTNDLQELNQIKERESTLLSRIERNGTEINDDILSDQNF